MRKSREKKPLLHVFVCNAAAYERGELPDGSMGAGGCYVLREKCNTTQSLY